MDWTAAGVITSTALGLIVLGIQVRDRSHAKTAAVVTGDRADRTEAIAREATAEARRSSHALERMAVAMERQAVAEAIAAPTPQVAWTLECTRGNSYLLTNAGNGAAHHVHIDTGDLLAVRSSNGLDRLKVDPGEAVEFTAARAWGTGNADVTVTWSPEADAAEQRSWARPLPPSSGTRVRPASFS